MNFPNRNGHIWPILQRAFNIILSHNRLSSRHDQIGCINLSNKLI